jgi:hypothetical protein
MSESVIFGVAANLNLWSVKLTLDSLRFWWGVKLEIFLKSVVALGSIKFFLESCDWASRFAPDKTSYDLYCYLI